MSQVIEVQEIGGPDALKLGDLEPEAPGPGTARVRIGAAGVNFIDVYFRTGLYPRPVPFVAGLEGAGVVEEIGAGASEFSVGDRVAWSMVPGSYAEHVIAPTDRLVAIPEQVSEEQAAAVMLQGMTAHYLVHGTRQTRPGDTALVHAGAGGVGLLLIQMLKSAKANVIATCSTEEKMELARGVGADEVILYTEEDFAKEVSRITEGRGVDVVYDSVGRTTFDGSLASLKPRGLLALYGQSSGPVAPFDLQRLNNQGSLFITRPSLAHYTADRDELVERASAVLGAVADGSLKVRIGARFALSDAADAHRALEGRQTTGKVILIPGD